MRSLAQANPRRGKKHILDMLHGEGWRVGTCLMKRRSRAEGLLVPQRRWIRGISDGGIVRCKATIKNEVWTSSTTRPWAEGA
jgi:hypothetical protein